MIQSLLIIAPITKLHLIHSSHNADDKKESHTDWTESLQFSGWCKELPLNEDSPQTQ